MLPINPITADHAMTTRRCLLRSWVEQKGNPKAHITPINAPPTAAEKRPNTLTPPFVPGGTALKVVIKNGRCFDRIPSSEDHVSAVAAA